LRNNNKRGVPRGETPPIRKRRSGERDGKSLKIKGNQKRTQEQVK